MSADPVQDIRSDRGAFDRALDALGVRQKGKAATCPWHDDKSPSASVLQGEDGTVRLYCHVCARSADVFDLREQAGGLPVAHQLRAHRAEGAPRASNPKEVPMSTASVYPHLDAVSVMMAKLGTVEAAYEYTDGKTDNPLLVVFRILPSDGSRKTFRQVSPCAGGWRCEAPPKPWPLYNLAQVFGSARVVVVEGEKKADALNALGIVATTSPCGAGKGEHADWLPLSGKVVVLWPDHDESGAKHMATVRRILEALPNPPRLSIIDPSALGLSAKGDAVDFIAASFAPDAEAVRREVEEVLVEARSLGPDADVERLLEDTIAGKRKAVAWPWPRLTELARALLPGTVTLLCGDPGCGKSFMLLQAAAAWHGQGERVALLELEEDRTYHLRRALAQRAGDSRLFDDQWIAGHPADVRAMQSEHRPFLADFGRQVFDAPQPMTLVQVGEWVEAQARAGARVIAVDPITAASGSDKPWKDDLAFVMKAKATATAYGASVVLVIHPKKGQRMKVLGLDDMAGGAGYGRFTSSVLWVEAFDEPKLVIMGERTATINRSIAILKSRNGPGTGARIGFNMEGRTLRFTEVGLVTGKVASAPGKRKRHDTPPSPAEDHFNQEADA